MRVQSGERLCDAADGDVRVLDRWMSQVAGALSEEIDAEVHRGQRTIDVVARYGHVILELLVRFVVAL
jgi:hypothetical protein